MRSFLGNLARALVSDKALSALYDMRKTQRPAEENRTRVTMVSCGVLFFACMAFLLIMAKSRQNADSWVEKQPRIELLPDARWEMTPLLAKSCPSGAGCYGSLRGEAPLAVDPKSYELSLPQGLAGSDMAVSLWRTALPATTFLRMASLEADVIAVSLPSFSFHRADLFVNGAFIGTTWNGDPLLYSFDKRRGPAVDLAFEVVFEVRGDQLHLSRAGLPKLSTLDRHLAVMPLADYRAYQEYAANDKVGKGDAVGSIARIAMAVFVLLLFLLIDGSPETLGLGLFLGFEAFAISCSFGWLPFGNVEAVRHFAFQMGDIFRVYFFLQIARISDKRVGPWLLWGGLASIIYGVARQIGPDYGWTMIQQMPRLRDFLAGSIGMVVCLRTAWYLRGKNLNWRVLALSVAAVGAFEQWLEPATIYVPALRDSDLVQTTMDLLQPVGAWLLAFSAFINISTLENRVRMLSGIEAKAKEMQNEMELGRSVQQAFMSLPKLPPEMQVACHHEAMLYVSGDTYFVDWNERHGKLTFLINDVTGHGVQAALKASGVSVIANTIWKERGDGPWRAGKLEEYGRMVADFYGRMDANADILAMGGGEFDTEKGRLSLYRVNFPFPILIEPKHAHIDGEESRKSDNWRITLLALANAQLTDFQLTDGTFVVITSDGYLDHSRRTTDFLRHMRKHLGTASADLAVEDIKKIILACDTVADRKDDDKTLTIFQWQRGRANVPNRPPREAA